MYNRKISFRCLYEWFLYLQTLLPAGYGGQESRVPHLFITVVVLTCALLLVTSGSSAQRERRPVLEMTMSMAEQREVFCCPPVTVPGPSVLGGPQSCTASYWGSPSSPA